MSEEHQHSDVAQDEQAALAADSGNDDDGGDVEMSDGVEPQLNADEIETLVLVNDDNGDTLMLDMHSGEGVFLQGGRSMAEIVVADDDEIMDEDVDLSFGSRELDGDEESGGWALPDVVGFLEERLLPEKAVRHSRNFRRELLLAARSLIDASLRGMESEAVEEDYMPAVEDDRPTTTSLPRRRPNARRAAPVKRGPQRIELD